MTRIAIVGTGFGGIGAAVRLLQDGERDLVLFERSDDVGGVWRDNTYPGSACDVASHLYSFSFAPTGRWSRRFAPQSEIHDYLRRVARDFGVLPHVRFRTEVLSATWDGAHWQLALSDGSTHEADVVVAACGQLSRPKRPEIPGLDDVAGTTFHSAEWDHGHDLRGRRVAVLGTGASAIQFVPEIAPKVAHLTVFQRSAPHVIAKPDRAYGPRTQKALEQAPWLLTLDRLRTFCVNETRSLGFNTEPRLMAGYEAKFARHLRKEVPDPALRARLTPSDPIGCKRILQSNDWYAALQLPHVDVVTERVDRVVPDGLLTADGVLHEVDTLILGTGFAATELLAPMEVVGREGRRLSEAWAQGAEAYLGTTVAGFPNLFLLYGPNTNLGHSSIVLMLESQIAYLREAVRLVRAVGAVEVRAEAMRAFNERLQERLKTTVFAGGCRSWYLDANGRNTQNWPGTTIEFRLRTKRIRLDDHLVKVSA
ncbi:MAG: 4-hydroxyacetophenone monooxygenase [Frankiales bacterium]|nr:4-hydroxyacetophenone monooxygenase [Frankiales bacterium]